MRFSGELRAAVALVLAGLLAAPPARALVSLNDGRERIFVSASTSISADSNIFANSDNKGDFVYGTSLAAEYTRRVGWIGVNFNIGVSSSRFAKFSSENFANPSVGLELTKQSGRTTGSFTISGARESRADASVNLRSDAWNFNYGLSFKYPIVSTYTLTGNFGYNQRDYANEAVFASLQSFSAAFDLLHTLTNERDMILGYRYRYSDTSHNTSSTDHGISAGLSGRLIRGIVGSLRLGYQRRQSHGPGQQGVFQSWSASASTSYAINKRISINGSIAKDFSTTATDSTVDTTTVSLDTGYTFNAHWSLSAGAGGGHTVFLGESGRIVLSALPLVLGPQRVDEYVNWNVGLNYSLNEHFKAALAYAWFRNWSNIGIASFSRSSMSLTLSTRW
jgi:hypothetical protein